MEESAQSGFGTDAVCVGETMALLVPDPPQPPEEAAAFRMLAGGAESNVAVHLARSGRRVVWHSALGDDGLGEQIRRTLTSEDVECRARVDHERPTGLYLKELGPDGTRVRYYRQGSAATALGPEDADEILGRVPALIHTTGITAALSDSTHALVTRLLTAELPGTLRSFDVNHRPALHGPHHAEPLLEAARSADIVFCGLDEAEALWGSRNTEEVHALMPEPRLLIVKQGADGATAFSQGRTWNRPAPEVEVVEPVGAGDAFAAGALHKLLAGAPVDECLDEGTRLAGQALRVHDDIPPRALAAGGSATAPRARGAG
ncbi:sugar kinase [Nocardiopsis sp. HNM0947]|uniref:Sugar kinase n=1 Tax=Nocardiopsis coralli TaxID=2772213 RepID=A0ABR9P7Z5_9ACTN|nr:sugar kinase [Nocardiopsis coralli]MBE2999970.1 sugar kinase [Nocardiopsis coralli]